MSDEEENIPFLPRDRYGDATPEKMPETVRYAWIDRGMQLLSLVYLQVGLGLRLVLCLQCESRAGNDNIEAPVAGDLHVQMANISHNVQLAPPSGSLAAAVSTAPSVLDVMLLNAL